MAQARRKKQRPEERLSARRGRKNPISGMAPPRSGEHVLFMANPRARHGERRIRSAILCLGLVLTLAIVFGAWAPDAFAVASALSWSEPISVDPGTVIKAISCPTATLCVAVDNQGTAITSTDPKGTDPLNPTQYDARPRRRAYRRSEAT
ncbi:MAG: hypothetical protein U0R71_11790 [Solirubrobacterales bacterium]